MQEVYPSATKLMQQPRTRSVLWPRPPYSLQIDE